MQNYRQRYLISVIALLISIPTICLASPGSQDSSPLGATASRGTANCWVINYQDTSVNGFAGWNVPGGGVAIWIDPEGSGLPGDPGCGSGSFDEGIFRVDSLAIRIADGSAIGSGTGNGVYTYLLEILKPTVEGDPCSEPNEVIWSSDPQNMLGTGAGTYMEVVPVDNLEVDGPFFVQWTIQGLSNPAEPASPFWDTVARPRCRQWITQDQGASYEDFTDFFVGGDVGWVDIVVDGAFEPDTVLDIPTLDASSLAFLALVLAAMSAIVIRRRRRA